MDRSPLFLAALASAAVPGLDPASVEALPSEPGQQFDVAFVQDTQHRRWVIRAPRTKAAGAQMDVTVALLGLLARRLQFSVPTPKGFVALKEGGRAAIYPYLAGQNIDFASLPPGPGLAAELGRAVAALHNVDHGLFEEAGLPAYDADTYRTRRLSELDRAAATGQVPTRLLSRWERALEDVTLWRFAPTPTHGDLTGDQVLAVFDDESDAASGRIRALTGWEDAKVADPADDFAALVTQASPEAFETVLEAYSHARVERPDKHLPARARLAAEMRQLSVLMAARAAGDRVLVERLVAALRRLDDRVQAEADAADDYRRTSPSPTRSADPVLVPPTLDSDGEDDDVEVMFAKTAEQEHPARQGSHVFVPADDDADPAASRDGTEDPDQPDQAEPHQSDQSDQPDQSDQSDQPDQPDQTNQTNQTNQPQEGEQPEAGTQADPGPEFEPGIRRD